MIISKNCLAYNASIWGIELLKKKLLKNPAKTSLGWLAGLSWK